MIEQEQILQELTGTLADVESEASLFQLKASYLGKSGILQQYNTQLKNLDPTEKKEFGQKLNAVKQTITQLFEAKLQAIIQKEVDKKLSQSAYDTSLRAELIREKRHQGGYHPLTLVKREMEDLFYSMGFTILDGPFVEDEFHNFTALNIPADHPARDMQDTFWFSDKIHCLRTHASPIEIRAMQELSPPFKFIAPAKVFRNEEIDASHESAFHQIEGMVIDKNIGVQHMIYFLDTLVQEILGKETKTRLRSGFFPFVEPGFELDVTCHLCHGSGCSFCKQSGWIEFCGCGLTHPNVLIAGGLDPEEWSGFAFGLGWDRFAMIRYGIEDIRHIQSADLRFSSQFRIY
ncbi:phenylalanine--tRNA ligase subunit alpha [Entomospira entomophila]|uniref:Phenylalanine--tRNA ligase alpha subunit n=1 Tax=Entomospira entomophila TaxID=2719988 RepID=A0A968GD19_9SPIO|nr:phenylalanine--tRNA ligase subunit alpha [Entomospira entomophilus]NIZ41216.1 phenylalanine--tRNA ligase subunit alpha [Entomospira entomophilus]WDI35422.1 phenylalanine--tRNA ligase subunit alpha [Entomospira entomophilus]